MACPHTHMQIIFKQRGCIFLRWFVIFFIKLINFNWRLITLQYCSGFVIHQHEFATGIHVFPILNPTPSSLPVPIPYFCVCLCVWLGKKNLERKTSFESITQGDAQRLLKTYSTFQCCWDDYWQHLMGCVYVQDLSFWVWASRVKWALRHLAFTRAKNAFLQLHFAAWTLLIVKDAVWSQSLS